MIYTTAKNTFIAIIFSGLLGVFLIGIVDPDVLINDSYSDNKWRSITTLIARLWLEKPIFFSVLFIGIVTWNLKGTKNWVGEIRISGKLLVPTMIFAYVLIVPIYILISNVTFPIPYPRTYDDNFKMVISVILMVGVSFLYKAFLFSLNERLASPTSILLIVLPFLPFYFGFSVWLNYAYTGVVDFLWFI